MLRRRHADEKKHEVEDLTKQVDNIVEHARSLEQQKMKQVLAMFL